MKEVKRWFRIPEVGCLLLCFLFWPGLSCGGGGEVESAGPGGSSEEEKLEVKKVHIPKHPLLPGKKVQVEELDEFFRELSPGETQAVALAFPARIFWSIQSYDVRCYHTAISAGDITITGLEGEYKVYPEGRFSINLSDWPKPKTYSCGHIPGLRFHLYKMEENSNEEKLGAKAYVALGIPLLPETKDLYNEIVEGGHTSQRLKLRKKGGYFLARVVIGKSEDFEGEFSDWRLLTPK